MKEIKLVYCNLNNCSEDLLFRSVTLLYNIKGRLKAYMRNGAW
jgi:hypothetical protein